jgi:hypothetical protein
MSEYRGSEENEKPKRTGIREGTEREGEEQKRTKRGIE